VAQRRRRGGKRRQQRLAGCAPVCPRTSLGAGATSTAHGGWPARWACGRAAASLEETLSRASHFATDCANTRNASRSSGLGAVPPHPSLCRLGVPTAAEGVWSQLGGSSISWRAAPGCTTRNQPSRRSRAGMVRVGDK
jgi:hypothetical protein